MAGLGFKAAAILFVRKRSATCSLLGTGPGKKAHLGSSMIRMGFWGIRQQKHTEEPSGTILHRPDILQTMELHT